MNEIKLVDAKDDHEYLCWVLYRATGGHYWALGKFEETMTNEEKWFCHGDFVADYRDIVRIFELPKLG